MKFAALLVSFGLTSLSFGQQTFQIPLDYTFATQCIDGPNNYANGGSVPSLYDGTSTLNWFSVPNTAIQLTTDQSCVFHENPAYQPTTNFSVVIRAKIDMDDVATITANGTSYVLWSNGPHFLAMMDDGNGGYNLSGGAKNGVGFGYQMTNLLYDGLLANAIDGGWVTFYMIYEQNIQTGNTSLNVSFNGIGANDNSATTTEPGLSDLQYDNPTNDFHLGADPMEPSADFEGMFDYCYFYNYPLSLTQRDQFDATVCEKLTINGTTLTPREPNNANLTYEWFTVTNPGSGDVFTTTGITTYSFTPTTSGTYMCKIGFGGIYSTITEYAIVTVGGVGLNENTLEEVTLFPNPTASMISIENAPDAAITIADISGKVILKIERYQGNAIQVADLEKGIYMIHVEKEGEQATIRFVKE